MYLQFRYVREYGYGVLFTGQMAEELDLPLWMDMFIFIFIFGYLLLIASRPRKILYLIASILYLGYALLDSLKGWRFNFITSLIVVVYFFFRIYHKKISIKFIITLFIIIIFFSVFMSYYRSDSKMNKINITDLIIELFYEQGVSIVVPMIIIENSNNLSYHYYPFIFSPIITEIYTSRLYPVTGQSRTRLEKYNLLGDNVTYFWKPSGYFKGQGLSGAFLAEMYDCGGILGIVFWSSVLALLIRMVEFYIYKNIFYLFVFWWIVRNIVFLPRRYFFFHFGTMPSTIVYVIMTMVLVFLIKYNKDRGGLLDVGGKI
jgi:oligosaccharide repeat unit polymerase